MALNSMCAMAWMKPAHPSAVPKPRRGRSRGCTSFGVAGRPGIRIGSGCGASSGIVSSPRAKASAAANVRATLSSGVAVSRQDLAASNNDIMGTQWRLRRHPPLLLRLVRTQLLDALEVARLDAGDVFAAEAGAVELS